MILRPEQCRAARGLLRWTQEHLAQASGVSRSTVRGFECQRHSLHQTTELQLVNALEKAGVLLLFPKEHGPGVRLMTDEGRSGKFRWFNPLEVRRIAAFLRSITAW